MAAVLVPHVSAELSRKARCRRLVALSVLLLAAFTLWTATAERADAEDKAQRPPNIVFFLADDLGYGDLGSFGQTKIRTPNLDRLAEGGMRLTRHYSGNAVCAPSRCVLMTGKHPGHAAVRNNRSIQPEGQWPLPADEPTLGKLLQSLGYVCGGFGKWGLGGPGSTGEPLKQGMNQFFGYNCQGKAHNFYPTYLWDDDKQVPLQNPDFASRQKLPADADPNHPASYAGYSGKQYSADLISEQARQFVQQHKDRPFFLYYPTTVPHLALQVPQDSLQEYVDKFDDEPYLGDRGYLPHRTPRAAYAAMVTRMDREIGSIIDLVEKLGLTEETIFVFSSDNGPLYDRHGGTDEEFFASAGGLRGRKGSLYEGGVRVPTIVSWKGRVPSGTQSDRRSGFEDWLPTLLELSGAKSETPKNVDGISLAPTLFGKDQPPRPFLYREFPAYGGQQAVWMGDWKGVRQNLLPKKNGSKVVVRTELYNLHDDPLETQDQAAAHPEIVKQIERIMREQHTPSEDFPFPALDDQAGG